MSKLFKLKEWLTLDEAANYIAASIGEDVYEKDILRLVLDKHLTLSVDLVNHSQGIKCDLVGPEGFKTMPSIGGGFSEMLIELAKEHGNYDPAHNYDEVPICLLYTSPSPRDQRGSRMPSSA